MPVLRPSEIQAAHVERIAQTWAEGPASDAPEDTAFALMLVTVCQDQKKRTVERVMVAPRRRSGTTGSGVSPSASRGVRLAHAPHNRVKGHSRRFEAECVGTIVSA